MGSLSTFTLAGLCILLICDLYLENNDFPFSATEEFWVINELMATSTQGQNNSLKSEKFNHSTDCFVYKTTKQPLWLIFFSLNWLLFFGNFIQLTNCLIQPEFGLTPFVNFVTHFSLLKVRIYNYVNCFHVNFFHL
jgi:hypothetical protein